jgi:hypothetical protein
MKKSALLISLVLLVVACGGAGETTTNGSCRWPEGASSPADASSKGCFPRSGFTMCQVAADGSQSCQDACTPKQYALTCDEATPPAAWGCKAIPIPTPANVVFYCCPCQ